jgi:hypothetical protein
LAVDRRAGQEAPAARRRTWSPRSQSMIILRIWRATLVRHQSMITDDSLRFPQFHGVILRDHGCSGGGTNPKLWQGRPRPAPDRVDRRPVMALGRHRLCRCCRPGALLGQGGWAYGRAVLPVVPVAGFAGAACADARQCAGARGGLPVEWGRGAPGSLVGSGSSMAERRCRRRACC